MNIPKDIFTREAYLNRIKPFINKGVIKVVTGQRRVGKSYLLYQIMALVLVDKPNADIIYINKEDLAFSSITNAEELNSFVLDKKKRAASPICSLMKSKISRTLSMH